MKFNFNFRIYLFFNKIIFKFSAYLILDFLQFHSLLVRHLLVFFVIFLILKVKFFPILNLIYLINNLISLEKQRQRIQNDPHLRFQSDNVIHQNYRNNADLYY